MEQITLTLTGKTLGDVAAQAMNFAQTAQGGIKLGTAPTTKAATTTTKTTAKKAAAPIEDLDLGDSEIVDDDLVDADLGDATDETDDASFDDLEEEAPAKVATKTTKAATTKLTEKDVSNQALAHSRKHGRPKTLAILKKTFKVGSLSELKPDQYAKVILALKP